MPTGVKVNVTPLKSRMALTVSLSAILDHYFMAYAMEITADVVKIQCFGCRKCLLLLVALHSTPLCHFIIFRLLQSALFWYLHLRLNFTVIMLFTLCHCHFSLAAWMPVSVSFPCPPCANSLQCEVHTDTATDTDFRSHPHSILFILALLLSCI